MTVDTRFANVLNRIANATSTIRIRSADAIRAESNGGSASELRERLEAAIARLEVVADELEDALA